MRILAAVLVLSAVLPSRATAQTAQLVRDINMTPDPSAETEPRDLASNVNGVIFVGTDEANGTELRVVTNPLGGSLVRDLSPGSNANSSISEVTASLQTTFFVFGGLWATNGTHPGTVLLKAEGPDFGSPSGLTDANGTLFFWAQGATSSELWKSDGTPQGTVRVAIVSGGPLVAVGSHVFFESQTSATGDELWTSNGSAAGTELVKDICPGTCSSFLDLEDAVAFGTDLYFAASDGASGTELWKSDGSVGNTVRVKDIVPGAGSGDPQGFGRFGPTVLFSAGFPAGLWRTDGTDAGTTLVRAGVDATGLYDAGDVAYFVGDEAATGRELWKTNGTPAGTTRVTDRCPGSCDLLDENPHFQSVPGNAIVFANQQGLWRSDGTDPSTFLMQPLVRIDAHTLTPFLNHVYFAGDDGVNGLELWSTDGSPVGTRMATDRRDASSSPRPLRGIGPLHFFAARRPDLGEELWSTLGTAPTTGFVDLTPGPIGSSLYGFDFGVAGASLLFGAYASGQYGLWKSDGTPAGTVRLNPTAVFSGFAPAGNVNLFAAGATQTITEPWRTDGTPAGTFKLAELEPGIAGSRPTSFVRFKDRVAFVTGGQSPGLWLSDGTHEGTTLVVPRSCDGLTVVENRIFMSCYDPATSLEPWVSDGTTSGTRLLKDLSPGTAQTNIFATAAVEDLLYFTDSYFLYRSDGTEAGTQRLTDFLGVPVGEGPRSFTVSNGVLYFVGYTAGTGTELWRTDGTPSGTFLVRDIGPGPESGVFASWDGEYAIAALGGGVVFAAYTPDRGMEPWFSDGTTVGTVPMPEIAPSVTSSSPAQMRSSGGKVYFTASDGLTGFEPWVVAPPTGAAAVTDVQLTEEDSGSSLAQFDVVLQSPHPTPVTVAYTTVPGTAQAGSDFTPVSGQLTFPPGIVQQPVFVTVFGDLADEPDETFTLELTAVGAVPLADRRGLATILDDDQPAASVQGVTVSEGDSGASNADFLVTLATEDGASTPEPKTVGYQTASGTATQGSDFAAGAGVVTFPAGSPSGSTQVVRVAVLGDTTDEPDETFTVRLHPASDATVPAQPATGVIADDDGIDSARPLELAPGLALRADLAPPAGRTTDRDWYVLHQQPHASYEIVVDETSGDAAPLLVRRVADGSTVLQTAEAIGSGTAVSLRWRNAASTAVSGQHVQVESPACGTTCGADDTYRVRAYETTLAGARFNNSDGQATVVILHNPTTRPIAGALTLWLAEGYRVGEQAFQLAPHATASINTGPLFFGGSGSLTVAHDGPYGSLVGKAVSLEPSSGFSFDTPLLARAR